LWNRSVPDDKEGKLFKYAATDVVAVDKTAPVKLKVGFDLVAMKEEGGWWDSYDDRKGRPRVLCSDYRPSERKEASCTSCTLAA